MKCTRCPSHAINPHLHGRDSTRPDLCDVCWWRNKAEKIEAAGDKLAKRHLLVVVTYPQAQQHVAAYNKEKGEA